MKAKLLISAAAGAMLALTGTAMAQQLVYATTDLEVRGGPGTGFPILGVMNADAQASVLGCDATTNWCEVEAGALVGWVDSGLLVTANADDDVYINEGPVDGTISGSIGGTFVEPAPPVITYIEENPYDPVYIESEVTVGTTLPETVEVYEIPDYEYRYVYVNGQRALVEPDTRRIVYIVR